jgi:hypothetical protein
MVNFIFEENNKELKERIAEAISYLIIKNKNFEIIEGADVLFDKKEKKYYDMNTGEVFNDNE